MACDHDSACRLVAEVSSRLMAIQFACRWVELTPAEKVDAVERLAGWAGEHLGVVIEQGCSCMNSAA